MQVENFTLPACRTFQPEYLPDKKVQTAFFRAHMLQIFTEERNTLAVLPQKKACF
jgi:hypothetical protein